MSEKRVNSINNGLLILGFLILTYLITAGPAFAIDESVIPVDKTSEITEVSLPEVARSEAKDFLENINGKSLEVTVKLPSGIVIHGREVEKKGELIVLDVTKIAVPDFLEVTKDEFGEMRYIVLYKESDNAFPLDLTEEFTDQDGRGVYTLKIDDINSLKWENLKGEQITLLSSLSEIP